MICGLLNDLLALVQNGSMFNQSKTAHYQLANWLLYFFDRKPATINRGREEHQVNKEHFGDE